MRRTIQYRFDNFPVPYFGGKRHAADIVWDALGDVDIYAEPFCGSCAVLLRRPHKPNRARQKEVVNDKDGLLVNALRAIQLKPEETVQAASWFPTEVDLTARHYAIVKWVKSNNVERLLADPYYCNPVIAGWWLFGKAMWIGSNWCTGDGPWVERNGRLVKTERKRKKENRVEVGVSKRRPSKPEGFIDTIFREEGITDVNGNYHDMVMPKVREWFMFLSARLRHVYILQGDWKRAVSSGTINDAYSTSLQGYTCGVFFDPPYSKESGRYYGLYTCDDYDVAKDVREWCIKNGSKKNMRIVLAGFDGEGHEELESHGWRKEKWYSDRYRTGGYGLIGDDRQHQQHRESLWISPHCLGGRMLPFESGVGEHECQ